MATPGTTVAPYLGYTTNIALANLDNWGPPFVVKPSGGDDTVNIQAAMNAAEAAGGGKVYCPAGTYHFNVPLGTYKIFLRPRNNVWLCGDGPATIFQAAAGLNTATTDLGFNFVRHVIADESRATIVNFVVSDITFDHNGVNNLIPAGFVGKDNVAVGIQAGSNLRVERCWFKDNAGRQTLSFGNNVNPQSCSQVSLLDNTFNDMGGSVTGNVNSTDHSSIYIQASNAEVSRNTFVNANGPKNNTALEIHCVDTNIAQNVVQNYFVMFNLVATVADLRRVIITENTGSGLQIGFNLWQSTPHAFDDVQVMNNTMRQASTSSNNFVLMSNVANGIASIDFINNRFSSAMPVNQAPVLACFEIGLVSQFTIRGNTIKNFPGRAIEYSTPTAGASIIIEDNLIVDCGTTTTGGNKQGIALNSLTTVGYLSIQRNKITNVASAYMTSGIIGNAPATQGQVDANFVVGVATAFGGVPAALLTTYNVREWGAFGNGAANDTPAFTAAIAACPSGDTINVPPGNYLVTNCLVNRTVTIAGHGDASIITVGAHNAYIFETTADNITLRNLQFVGDMTGTSSINGIAILLASNRFVSVDCLYTNFWFGGISGIANTATLGPQLDRNRFLNNGGVIGTADVYMGGAWIHSSYTDNQFLVTTALCGTSIFHYDLGTTGIWYDVQIRGGSVEGYQKWGIVLDDETWDGTELVDCALIHGVTLRNIKQQGIKCKVSRGIRITDCFLDNCSQVAENQSAGLYGSIHCNSLNRIIISGNIIRQSGTDGIRVACGFQFPLWNPGGQACAQFSIIGNIIENTGQTIAAVGNGITAISPIKNLLIIGNSIRGASTIGISCLSSATLPMWDIGIFNNTIGDCAATCTNAVYVQFARNLRMNGNLGQNAGVNMCFVSDVDTCLIGSSDMMLDPRTGPGARGYQFTNTTDVTFNGKAGNSVYANWAISTVYTMGTLVNANNGVWQCVVAGTSAATGTGPTGTGGVTDGTVTWYYIGFYQGMTNGLVMSTTVGTLVVGDSANWKNLLGPPIAGSPPASYKRAGIASGTATFATATTVVVTLPQTETDNLYRVTLCPLANQSMWVTSKTTTQFTINTATASSTASVDWAVTR